MILSRKKAVCGIFEEQKEYSKLRNGYLAIPEPDKIISTHKTENDSEIKNFLCTMLISAGTPAFSIYIGLTRAERLYYNVSVEN